MKHIYDKYDDVAETLKTITISIIVTAAILGVAPMIMALTLASF